MVIIALAVMKDQRRVPVVICSGSLCCLNSTRERIRRSALNVNFRRGGQKLRLHVAMQTLQNEPTSVGTLADVRVGATEQRENLLSSCSLARKSSLLIDIAIRLRANGSHLKSAPPGASPIASTR